MATTEPTQARSPSPSLNLPAHVTGYPGLSEFMASTPPMIHFRTFLADAVHSLLRAQAELIHLLEQYHQVQQEDSVSPVAERRDYNRCWRTMAVSSGRQQRLSCKVREKLNAYQDDLLRLSRICGMPGVNRADDLEGVQNFISDEASAGRHTLEQDLRDVYGSDNNRSGYAADLVAVIARFRNDEDRLSRWAAEEVATRAVRHFKRKPAPGEKMIDVYDDTVQSIVGALQCTLSSVIPMAAVCTLYAVKSPGQRLAILAVSNLAFTWTLFLLSKVKTSEIFAVSAAFLSVCIVFIGGGGGGLNNVTDSS